MSTKPNQRVPAMVIDASRSDRYLCEVRARAPGVPKPNQIPVIKITSPEDILDVVPTMLGSYLLWTIESRDAVSGYLPS